MWAALNNIFVQKFYKVNAGFFLFVLLIFFGILPANDTLQLHKALMLQATSSAAGIVAMSAFSVAYAWRCLSFMLNKLALPENSFLYAMQGLANRRQAWLLCGILAGIYAPWLLYGGTAVALAISSGQYSGGMTLAVVLVAILLLSTAIVKRRVNGTYKPGIIALPRMRVFRQKQYHSFLLHYSLSEKKGAFLSVKIFSLLALQLLVALNADKASKENVCFLIMLSITAHALLPVYYIRFTEGQMPILRNMPISLTRRYSTLVFTYAVVLLPELLFLLWNEHNIIPLYTIAALYILSIVRLLLYSALQYVPGMTTNKFTSVIFVMFFGSMILLASVPLWLFIVFEGIISTILFYTLFYRYDPSILNEQ